MVYSVTTVLLLHIFAGFAAANSNCLDLIHGEYGSWFQLECSQDGIIVGADVASGLGTCSTRRCLGFSPYILQTYNNCHWKENCTIMFDKQTIVKTEDHGSCFGQTPQFLTVNNYDCFVPIDGVQVIRDFGLSCNDEGNNIGAPISGLLRSHEGYPWNYKKETYYTANQALSICSLKETFWFNRGSDVLIVTVKTLDLNENDRLSFATGKDSVNVDMTQNKTYTFYKSNISVTLQFDIDWTTTGGRGFIICFKWVTTNTRVKSACEGLLQRYETPKLVDETTTQDSGGHVSPRGSIPVTDVCNGKRKEGIKQLHQFGLITSHNYGQKTLRRRTVRRRTKCVKKFDLSGLNKHWKVRLQLYTLKLKRKAQLSIRSGRSQKFQVMNDKNWNMTFSQDDHPIRLKHSGDIKPRSGKGFIICYGVYGKGELIEGYEPCQVLKGKILQLLKGRNIMEKKRQKKKDTRDSLFSFP